ncbi:hypothetical protein ENHAE0001_1201 [Enhydrobacter aerosaccus SK60]|nr:hypothetical protein ENHAE0001_1201 [Enhydrobacter aerosaccus SK60]
MQIVVSTAGSRNKQCTQNKPDKILIFYGLTLQRNKNQL